MKRIVIVGAGNAGITCAKTVRKLDENAEIIIISDENYPPYCRCLLTYFIENKADDKILFDNYKKILKDYRIKYIQGENVDFVEANKSQIKLNSGKTIDYDKLFLGIGAKPKKNYFDSDNSIPVTNLRKYEEALKIKDTFKRGDTAVIEGGGLVSLKTLLALYEIGVKIYWVVKSPYILSYLLDEESAKIIENFIIDKGIVLYKNCSITGVKNSIVKLSNGNEIKANGIVIGKGVVANKIDADVELKFDDGYIVNDYFQVFDNIFAGGDCTKIYDKAHNQRWKVALWPIAGNSGLFAGKNICSMNVKFNGAVPVNSFSVFNNDIIAAGKKKINENEKDEFYKVSESKGNVYKSFIYDKNNNLKGFVFINDIFKSGMYYYNIN